jgi:hypothetical protein
MMWAGYVAGTENGEELHLKFICGRTLAKKFIWEANV